MSLRVFAVILVALSSAPVASMAATVDGGTTQLEAFLGSKGKIIVSIDHPLRDVLARTGGGAAKLSATVVYEPGKRDAALKGVRIDLDEGHGTRSAFIDHDELSELLDALEYMNSAIEEWKSSPGDVTGVSYVTAGGFAIGFITLEGDLYSYMQVTRAPVAEVLLKPVALKTTWLAVNEAIQYLASQ